MTPRTRRFLLAGMVGLAGLALAVLALFRLSPWPGALLIRHVFDEEGERVARALDAHLPADVTAWWDEVYDPADPDARLDVFHPAAPGPTRATIVWIHGGAFVAGSKGHVAGYARILAARGFTVAGVGYSLAPWHRYPKPVLQVDAALGHLQREAARLRVDPARFVLAGDSAGAHIAAQLACAISDPGYAAALGLRPAIRRDQLAGVILHCGPYDARRIDASGRFGGFLRTVLWAYIGRRDFTADPAMATFSVVEHVTATFPPAFISAGNADPLEPQSRALAAALAAQGVRVDPLFFPADHTASLPHEYQFHLDTAEGRLALERTLAFLDTL